MFSTFYFCLTSSHAIFFFFHFKLRLIPFFFLLFGILIKEKMIIPLIESHSALQKARLMVTSVPLWRKGHLPSSLGRGRKGCSWDGVTSGAQNHCWKECAAVFTQPPPRMAALWGRHQFPCRLTSVFLSLLNFSRFPVHPALSYLSLCLRLAHSSSWNALCCPTPTSSCTCPVQLFNIQLQHQLFPETFSPGHLTLLPSSVRSSPCGESKTNKHLALARGKDV